MKIIFMGTPDFAVPCLEMIHDKGHDVCAVFTNPDKPKGRGYEVVPSPVKKKAVEFGLKVFQPLSLKDSEVTNIISNYSPDVIVVVAYGKILPESILSIPKLGCVNVHASLLPKLRGAAPIQWAIINGENETGVTTMFMDKGLDTGDIIQQKKTVIGSDETAGELFDRLCIMGANLLLETLDLIESGDVVRTKQEEGEATYSKLLNKTFSNIDWNCNAITIHNKVRGLNPWPGASTYADGKLLRIHRTKVANLKDKKSHDPGVIVSYDPVIVSCGNGDLLELVEVQYQGKKRMSAVEFFRGHMSIKKFYSFF